EELGRVGSDVGQIEPVLESTVSHLYPLSIDFDGRRWMHSPTEGYVRAIRDDVSTGKIHLEGRFEGAVRRVCLALPQLFRSRKEIGRKDTSNRPENCEDNAGPASSSSSPWGTDARSPELARIELFIGICSRLGLGASSSSGHGFRLGSWAGLPVRSAVLL